MKKFLVPQIEISLKLLGVWPNTKTATIIYVLLFALSLSLIFQFWNVAVVFYRLELLMNNLGTTMPLALITLKLGIFCLNDKKISYVIAILQKDFESEGDDKQVRKVTLKNLRLAAMLSNTIAVCYNGLPISYLVLSIMSSQSDPAGRKLVMQSSFPWDERQSPIFEITCFVQFLLAMFGSNGHATIEGFLTISVKSNIFFSSTLLINYNEFSLKVLHANSKAVSVCREISKFSNVCQSENDRVKITHAKRKLIEKHLSFIHFSECISDIYSFVSFFHLFFMTLINCIVGFMIINLNIIETNKTATLMMCMVYMFTALTAVGSYCVAGEYLTSQGNMILDAMCSCLWYKFQAADVRALSFMIMRSRKPVILTCGNYTSLSLIYFTKIIKTSVSFLSLVRAASPIFTLSTIFTSLPFQFWKAALLTDNPTTMMDSFSDSLSMILIILKFIIMWNKRSYVTNLLADIQETWSGNLPTEWETLARYCRIFCTFDMGMYLCAVILYYPEIISNYFGGRVETRALLFKSHYPFDFHKTPVYELILLTQIVQGWLIIFCDSLSKCLLVAYIFHTTALIDELLSQIENFSISCKSRQLDKSVKVHENFQRVVLQHRRILALVQQINMAYSLVSVVQILFSTLLICVTGFVLVTAMENSDIMIITKFIAFIIAMLSQIFTFCVAGQYLQNKAENIHGALYDCFWYVLEPKEAKLIVMALNRAQKPLTLTGENMFDLSISTFLKVKLIRNKYSYDECANGGEKRMSLSKDLLGHMLKIIMLTGAFYIIIGQWLMSIEMGGDKVFY
uniref:Odorant receptor n=1 Tax=Trichogramma kaykai TaxID=54128 RepID=A0ABD2XAX6_9HYME